MRKEDYLFILRELAKFSSFILEVMVSSQHALHMAGFGEYIFKLNAFLLKETSITI